MKRILLVLFVLLLLLSFVSLFLSVRPGNLYNEEYAIYDSLGQTYRFSFFASFLQTSFTVRVQINDDGTADLFYRGDFITNRGLLRSGRARLNETETQEFFHLLNETDFWNLPTEVDRMGTDGHTVTFEGAEDGMYHIVNRWVPTSDDPVSRIKQFFFDLVEQRFPISHIVILFAMAFTVSIISTVGIIKLLRSIRTK